MKVLLLFTIICQANVVEQLKNHITVGDSEGISQIIHSNLNKITLKNILSILQKKVKKNPEFISTASNILKSIFTNPELSNWPQNVKPGKIKAKHIQFLKSIEDPEFWTVLRSQMYKQEFNFFYSGSLFYGDDLEFLLKIFGPAPPKLQPSDSFFHILSFKKHKVFAPKILEEFLKYKNSVPLTNFTYPHIKDLKDYVKNNPVKVLEALISQVELDTSRIDFSKIIALLNTHGLKLESKDMPNNYEHLVQLSFEA